MDHDTKHTPIPVPRKPAYDTFIEHKHYQKIVAFFCILSLYFLFNSGFHNKMRESGRDDANLSQYSQTIFLPYIYKFRSEGIPMVRATIDGVDLEMPMDTGSTGLLIGAPLLPNVGPDEGIPAYEYLTSSNILYNGRLVNLNITFHGKGDSYATSRVPVLVVDKSVVCPWYDPNTDTFDCPHNPDKPEPEPRDTSKITYMGVGFGRNKPGDGQPNAVPSGNPFLNMLSINGKKARPETWRAGYTISKEGVHLGLTQANTQGFVFTDLQPGVTHDDDPRDWSMVDMCFSINGSGANCGVALIDTGIAQMYIRAGVGVELPNITIRNPNKDGYAEWVKRVKPGTKISIGFPSLSSKAVAEYSFSVSEGSAMEPSYVVPGKQRSPPYVNTGRNFLFGYSVALDAIAGRFGFRLVEGRSAIDSVRSYI